MTRGVPTAGFRRTRDKSTNELVIPAHIKERMGLTANGNDKTVAPNVIAFPQAFHKSRDAVTVKEGNKQLEVRAHFQLGSDPKGSVAEHTLTIVDGKVDFLTKMQTA